MQPYFSIIIPTYNEEKYIGRALKSIKEQSFKNYEVIIVDSYSNDNTVDIAKSFGCKVIIDKKKGVGLARHIGALHAKGKFLYFTDADVKLGKNLLLNYYNALKDNNYIAATGPLVPLEKSNILMKFGFKIVSNYFIRLSLFLNKPSLIGSNFVVRRDIYFKAGGFNTKYKTYEDFDLAIRIGRLGKVLYLKSAVVATSTRRVKEWGIAKFAYFHISNMIRYSITKKPHESYEPIR